MNQYVDLRYGLAGSKGNGSALAVVRPAAMGFRQEIALSARVGWVIDGEILHGDRLVRSLRESNWEVHVRWGIGQGAKQARFRKTNRGSIVNGYRRRIVIN